MYEVKSGLIELLVGPCRDMVQNMWFLFSAFGFPGGSVVKNVPANAGNMGSVLVLGRSPQALEQLSPCAATTEAYTP